MDINLLTIIVLAGLLVFAVRGLRRGLVRSVFSTFSIIIAIVIAVNFSPQVSKVIQGMPLYDSLTLRVEEAMFKDQASESGTADYADMDDPTINEQASFIDDLPFPRSVKNALMSNNNSEVYEALGVSGFKNYIAGLISCFIVNALSLLIIFILALIAVRLIGSALNIIARLPVLHALNKIGGFAFGLVNGLVIVWVLGMILTFFTGTQAGQWIYGQISESRILTALYNGNFLVSIITNLRYLLT